MAKKELGDTIDIHGGGLDLVFPHHENEVAQSECANGAPFARYWMHNGLLTMATGAKMGKSEGNAVEIGKLLQVYPAEGLRLYYLQNHYRSPLPWDENALPEALGMLARLYDAREVAESLGGGGDADKTAAELGKEAREVLELGRTLVDRLHAAMDDDFNSAQALGHCFELARAINRFANGKSAKKRGAPIVAPALKAFKVLADALGLLAQPTREFQDEIKQKRLGVMGIDRQQVEQLLVARHDARAQKDWTKADDLRVQLDQLGIVVMDRPEGVDWRVRLAASEA
jgi:cysteinyl-tRNA synthetase